jgi:hypothetical protein
MIRSRRIVSTVIASDSEAIQTKRPPQSLSLDCFALLAMTPQIGSIQNQRAPAR